MKLHQAHSKIASAVLAITLAASFAAAQNNPAQAGDDSTIKPGKAATTQSNQTSSPRPGLDTSAPADAQHNKHDSGAMVLTDGQILQIVHTLSDGEIKQAKVALDKSANGDVKQTAQMIRADHESANSEVDKLAKGKLALEDSPLNKTLTAEGEKTYAMLQKLSGTQYDCAYLQQQVAQHKAAIDIANHQLMTNAKDDGVRKLLTATGPKLEHHQMMAQSGYSKASCK